MLATITVETFVEKILLCSILLLVLGACAPSPRVESLGPNSLSEVYLEEGATIEVLDGCEIVLSLEFDGQTVVSSWDKIEVFESGMIPGWKTVFRGDFYEGEELFTLVDEGSNGVRILPGRYALRITYP